MKKNILIGAQVFCWQKSINPLGQKPAFSGFCPALEQYPLYFIKNDKNLIFFQVIIQITSKHKFWTIGHLVFGHPWWNEAGTKCKCQLKARAKVSLLGVESHCTFIPTDWGSYVKQDVYISAVRCNSSHSKIFTFKLGLANFFGFSA